MTVIKATLFVLLIILGVWTLVLYSKAKHLIDANAEKQLAEISSDIEGLMKKVSKISYFMIAILVINFILSFLS